MAAGAAVLPSGAMAAGEAPPTISISSETNNGVMFWGERDGHHRIGGPAFIAFDKRNGQVYLEVYRMDGQFHGTDGPAITFYDEVGNVTERDWWVGGVLENEWRVAQLR